jgi:predicted dehydrogenase
MPIFIEKPLAHNMDAARAIYNELGVPGDVPVVIGYSLRFHPALSIIRTLLSQIGTPLYARAEVGQYLPDWHPTEDYRNWYMAHESQGGGALLDLSHEIDYKRWLFGNIGFPEGIVTNHIYSGLEIDSDSLADFTCVLGTTTFGSIHMNLLDRSYNRRLRILGSEGTIDWDYTRGSVRIKLPGEPMATNLYDEDRNIQFIEEMRAFIQLVKTGVVDERFSTLEDGIEVLKVVDSLKRQNGRGIYGC